MVRTVKFGALIAAVAMIGTVYGGSLAMAQDECESYAQQSAKQEQENQAKNCGFKGEQWSTDLDALRNFCQSVAPDEWNRVLDERKAQLASCGG